MEIRREKATLRLDEINTILLQRGSDLVLENAAPVDRTGRGKSDGQPFSAVLVRSRHDDDGRAGRERRLRARSRPDGIVHRSAFDARKRRVPDVPYLGIRGEIQPPDGKAPGEDVDYHAVPRVGGVEPVHAVHPGLPVISGAVVDGQGVLAKRIVKRGVFERPRVDRRERALPDRPLVSQRVVAVSGNGDRVGIS